MDLVGTLALLSNSVFKSLFYPELHFSSWDCENTCFLKEYFVVIKNFIYTYTIYTHTHNLLYMFF